MRTPDAVTSDSPLWLVRPELRSYAGYSSARIESACDEPQPGQVWLNANESAWENPADPGGHVRRYPDPQPARLRTALAELYGCEPAQLLACRGSDEAIDLLVRALCRPGGDAITITPPTFGMYAVSAHLNATRVIEVPQRESSDRGNFLTADLTAVGDATLAGGARVVFVASPGNPSGALLPLDDIRELAQRLSGQALLVVDEAYLEFADASSAATLVRDIPNIAVLRTLSKAHALAGARIGAVIARSDLIAVLQRCQAPYPLPGPSVDLACAALETDSLARTEGQVAQAVAGRERLTGLLQACAGVTCVYSSSANFVLARFFEPQEALSRLLTAGIVVRDMRDKPFLGDALRISVGSPADLDRVERVLAELPAVKPGPVTSTPLSDRAGATPHTAIDSATKKAN